MQREPTDIEIINLLFNITLNSSVLSRVFFFQVGVIEYVVPHVMIIFDVMLEPKACVCLTIENLSN